MPVPSPRKLVSRLTQPQFGLLRRLTVDRVVDAESLQTDVDAVVQDRTRLANALLEAAHLLAQHDRAMVKRGAASRAYYAAYHMARAAVFAVHRRDEDDHERLPASLDSLPGLSTRPGTVLKELRQLRNEMDDSPYPGPDQYTEYDATEIEHEIAASLQQAETIVQTVAQYLAQRP